MIPVLIFIWGIFSIDEKKLFKLVKDQNGRVVDHSRYLVNGQITVLDFYATWCGPCKQMDPILTKIAGEYRDVALRKVDIGNWGSYVSEKYAVSSVPNVRVFDKKGRLVGPPTSNPDKIVKYIETAQKRN